MSTIGSLPTKKVNFHFFYFQERRVGITDTYAEESPIYEDEENKACWRESNGEEDGDSEGGDQVGEDQKDSREEFGATSKQLLTIWMPV